MSVFVAGFTKVSLIDYPKKVAITVFLSGCNFSCGYCHNKSLIPKMRGESNQKDAFFAYLKKRQGLLDGVCITGGEPLLSEGIVPFIEEIKALGYLVKLDTNGSFPKILERLVHLDLLDYVAMDIKTAFPFYHEVTAKKGDEAKIKESLALLKSETVAYELRTTFIKPLHSKARAKMMFEAIAGTHPYYLQNFRKSEGIEEGFYQSFSKDEMLSFLTLAKGYLPKAALREI